jgi:hypothetical protein
LKRIIKISEIQKGGQEMKKLLVALIVIVALILSTIPASAAPLPVQVIVVTPEGQTSLHQYVSGMPLPTPEPCGGVIVTYSDGAITVFTCECVCGYDAAGNPWEY